MFLVFFIVLALRDLRSDRSKGMVRRGYNMLVNSVRASDKRPRDDLLGKHK